MIEYKCPKCGSPVFQLTYATLPPIHKYMCPQCGWEYEEQEEVVKVTYDELRDKKREEN